MRGIRASLGFPQAARISGRPNLRVTNDHASHVVKLPMRSILSLLGSIWVCLGAA